MKKHQDAVLLISLGLAVVSVLSYLTLSPQGRVLYHSLQNAALTVVTSILPPHRDTSMQLEHHALMELVPLSAVTNTVAKSGYWSDPSIWTGGIPAAGARVYIPKGVTVVYDIVSDVALKTVRIDGKLAFAPTVNTKMVVETIAGMAGSEFEAGTDANPIQSGVTARIVVSDPGAINLTEDPMRIGRGVVLHGKAIMRGETKTSWLPVSNQPRAGGTQITLSKVPTNWRVGDKVVLTATNFRNKIYTGTVVDLGTFDEERTIRAISGNTVTVDPLQFDHTTNRSSFTPYLANYTRNIVIESQKGAGAAIQQRGHVMFMHSGVVDVKYVAFDHLGRTNKALFINDATFDSFGNLTPGTGTNQRGRYSVHIHRVGTNNYSYNPAHIQGSSVWGSPGWGFVSHDSYALIEDNASYDVLGSHYVTETGNEIGSFKNNIAIKAPGHDPDTNAASPKDSRRVALFDLGDAGHGFWFQSRMTENTGNVVSSAANAAYIYFHRGDNMIGNRVQPEQLQHPEIIKLYKDALGATQYAQNHFFPDHAPIRKFSGNVAQASYAAFQVIKAGPNQEHDQRNIVENFNGFNNCIGMDITYTAHYTFRNVYLLSNPDNVIPKTNVRTCNGWAVGISFAPNVHDMVVENVTIDGYRYGFRVADSFVNASQGVPTPVPVSFIAVDPKFINGVQIKYVGATSTLSSLSPWPLDAKYDQYEYTSATVPSSALRLEVNPNLSYVVTKSPTNNNDPFYLRGIKYDSYGPTAYEQRYDPNIRITPFYMTPDGKKVIHVKAHYFDRKTNECKVHHFKLDVTAVTALHAGYSRGKDPGIPTADTPCEQNDVAIRFTPPSSSSNPRPPVVLATCTWDGATIASGASVTAYQSSSVVHGQTCTSQQRTCTDGTLSGTYANTTCTVAAAPVVTPGRTPPPAPVVTPTRDSSTTSSSETTTTNTNASTGSTASGGGGGGGSSSKTTTTRTETNAAKTTTASRSSSGGSSSSAKSTSSTVSATTNTQTSSGGSSSGSKKRVSSELSLGSSGENVVALQEFLSAQGVLTVPAGTALGYYGGLTRQAVQAFQLKEGVIPTPSTPGAGNVGPKTLARINAVIDGSVGSSASTLVTTTVSTASSALFTQALNTGSSGLEVTLLQEVLKAKGYIAVNSTGYYGPVTTSGVALLQAAHGLDAVGHVGPLTRVLLNSGSIKANSSAPAAATSPAPAAAPAAVTAPAAVVAPAAAFSVGQTVRLIQKTTVHTTPNGVTSVFQPSGTTGIILRTPAQEAGYTWWNIHFSNGYYGWVMEDVLAR